MNWRRFFLCALLVLGLFWLAACATSAPEEMTEEPVVEEPATEELITEEAEATPQPAVEPEVVSSPTLPPPPVTQPSEPLPTPVIEQRMVELEWPPRLRLGNSDFVRLTLIPQADGYTVTTEFPDHTTVTETIEVQHESGYQLAAAARLDGVAFEISPADGARIFADPGPAGHLALVLAAAPCRTAAFERHFAAALDSPGRFGQPPRQAVAFSRSLDVRVVSFFGLTRGQAMTGGLLGLFFGGGLSVVALTGVGQPARAALRVLDPNPALALEPRPGLALANAEAGLLRALFGRYARLVVESEFLSGYSGARTFLVQPIRMDGRADAYTIVKIGQPEFDPA